ncbi:MAG: sulfatase-like hydrolase/transferase [Gemmatimonadetes bacterium]|nr:sulfatase-like hydrolase/transferase [Gemmatimonadota bacterium]
MEPSRRDFLRIMGTAAAGACMASTACADPPVQGNGRNVLFIPVDDLNDWVGCLGGHPDVQTPNIDRLAGQGVLFSRAYCPAPLCNPSRTAVLTGLRPTTTGVYSNSPRPRDVEVLRGRSSIPRFFRENGYRVMGSGKISHGRGYSDRGDWHEFWPSLRRPRPQGARAPFEPMNGIEGTGALDWGPLDVPDEEMSDWKVAEWAGERLSEPHDRPFFLAAGVFRPHGSWYVPRKYFDMYPLESVTLPTVLEGDLADVPEIGRPDPRAHGRVVSHGQWRDAVQAYLASVTFADACIGKILDALERGPHADNTAVVLWSDHGLHLGEKLRWGKSTAWEQATRSLMIWRDNQAVEPGRCDQPVGLIDIYPTLAALCGLTPPSGLEGQDLRPLLDDPDSPDWQRPPVVTTLWPGVYTVRSQRWRYTRYLDGSEEVYDHSNDPEEWTNLAELPEIDPVKAELGRWMPRTAAEPVER